jgi:pyruvate dehydrogenase E2 component (dihydrolipoamide acetyltransferase)
MRTHVIMPALELAQETGTVLRWLKSSGDRVRKGEPLVEIETDKVTTEIEAPASGVLGELTAREGDVVPVGRTIAVIVEEAGPIAPAAAAAPAPAAGGAVATASAAAIEAPAEQRGVGLGQVRTTGGGPARLVAASPKARRLATERGLDAGALHGSGPGGAVLAADVLAAPRPAAAGAPRAAEPAVGSVPRPEGPGVGTVWRIMAERMTASWTTVPHFYLYREVAVSRLVAWRDRANAQAGARITYTDLLLRLVAAALARHPGVNASWKAGAIVRHAGIDIGLAVAIDDGLVVPVIRRADALTLAEIAARREDLVSRAQAGTLRPADIQGGGFTISNLGMYGVDAFSAIVNPPQAAILAVGRIADRVVAAGGQPTVQPTMMVTLSCDHRVVDGARGAQFLGTLAELIEEPLALLG